MGKGNKGNLERSKERYLDRDPPAIGVRGTEVCLNTLLFSMFSKL